ncbi:MAG: bifunctional riboflavin kinase/FAD synthetase [Thermodesulfobacteriota bacterium]|nr:bifunctional riboflavin kinase/FAD synthetase [Thermodesulfobacteriota bacterium]
MKIIENLDDIKMPFKKAVITIGNFDGVHIGHQALFHEVIEKADIIGGTSIAMTFEPHPIKVLKKNSHPPLITLYEQKVELIEKSGLDVLICVPFTLEFAALSAREFVEDILIRQIGMTIIVVGEDYGFGKNREGNIDYLRTFAELFDFQVILADWIQEPNGSSGRISSTKIRELVISGHLEEVPKLLGRYYQIRGVVATGRNRGGRLLGFPTANINLHDELCPKTGVYAVTVEFRDIVYHGVANIGYSPTFDDHVFTVEVHILGFDENIYGQNIRVNFISHIRDEIKFENINELSAQIRQDIEKARKILS